MILEDEMARKWSGRSYDLFARNCCSFSRSFCKRLTGDNIPDWVDRLPRMLDVVTKPVKGVGQIMASTPPRMLASGRETSMESEDDMSVYSFATTAIPTPMASPAPTPKYDNSEPSFGLRSTIESV